MPVNIINGTQSQLVLFLVLNMWPSHFGLPVLLAIILLSKRIKRHPTFINLCVGFIIIGVSSSLLVYAGRTTGPQPSKMLCLFQASILYGYPAFASLLAMMLVLQMFLTVRAAIMRTPTQGPQTVRTWAMIIAPYVALAICILATAVVGAENPDIVTRDRRFFYCSIDSDPLSGTIAVFGAVFCLVTVVLEVMTLTMIYKLWKAGKQPGAKAVVSIELSLPLRVMAFGMFVFVAMGLSLLSVKAPESPVPDLVIAFAATIVILIFGTQPDILRALCFWRREPILILNAHSGTVTPSGDKAREAAV
ncbi:hypothetical protein FB45DRAFT_903048 [Roridomyces roridus]|uniref:Uncharacterized protein n=1 Tax=Roridomyces roridus TaxID=1738132 RepID=A0AAD7C434_9AGAR|nr:hypothetical protein FB45DRAFT_903048 [Roridomyces roridus]